MHSTAAFLFVVFVKGVVEVEPTCTRFLPPLKTGERGSSVAPCFVIDKTLASDTTGRRAFEVRIPTARDSFMIKSDTKECECQTVEE